jgi:hypothetical protein
MLAVGLTEELVRWQQRGKAGIESNWAEWYLWSEYWDSEELPRETGGLHCRGYIEHPLGGPGSTLLEAASEEIMSQDLTDEPSNGGLPRETGGLHCRGHIERPLGGPGSTQLEASPLVVVDQLNNQLGTALSSG